MKTVQTAKACGQRLPFALVFRWFEKVRYTYLLTQYDKQKTKACAKDHSRLDD
jgi:hypothetical protein